MHLLTVATLVSGGLASAISTSRNPFAEYASLHYGIVQRRVAVPSTASANTCGSYVTVTVTPAAVTVTNSAYATTTAETVTTTQVSITESTQEATKVATATSFETSFVTETKTVATVTQTVLANKLRKKRGKCAHNPSAAAAVCTTTVTASAPVATTTTTITGSATATATQTVTSLAVATVTVTVSTTEVKTTAVPTTVPATATTTVMAQPTPTFIAKAVGGTVNGQYLTIPKYTISSAWYHLEFTPDVSAAARLYVNGDGRLISTGHDANAYAYIAEETSYNSAWYLVPANQGAQSGGHAATCKVTGPTTVGSTGSLTCPNGSPEQGQFSDDGFGLTTTNGARGNVLTLQYVVV